MSSEGTVSLIRPAGRFCRLDVRELWAFRELAWLLALRELKVRYRQAWLGVAWAVLQPAASAVVFVVVFHRLLGIESAGMPYWAFAAVGLIAWYYASGTIESMNTSLVEDQLLVTKVYFPRLLVPVAAALPGLLDVGVSLAVVLVAVVATGIGLSVRLVALAPLLVALVAVTAGGGLLSATFTVRYRDTRHITSMAMQLLFFATPLAYPSSVVPPPWRPLYYLNPFAGLVDSLRWSIARGPAPGWAALSSVVGGLALITVGLLAYLAQERRMADVI